MGNDANSPAPQGTRVAGMILSIVVGRITMDEHGLCQLLKRHNFLCILAQSQWLHHCIFYDERMKSDRIIIQYKYCYLS